VAALGCDLRASDVASLLVASMVFSIPLPHVGFPRDAAVITPCPVLAMKRHTVR
jgi:hypothetical protein